jgi:ABC-type lipoprotein export system ATPase subunit
MVIVTHSHDVAQAADRRIAMKDGQIQSGHS